MPESDPSFAGRFEPSPWHALRTFAGPMDLPRVYDEVDTRAVGPYRLGDALGRGRMANVVAAVDVRNGNAVAVKILQEHCAAASEAVARFIREGRALATLNHPNIVKVLDHGITDDGRAWMAMERLRGVTLDALVRDERRLHPQRALRIAIEMARALATVHARGLVHRDLKPENVFIVAPDTHEECAKLIDFGLAHVTENEMGEHSIPYTQVGSILGSAAFMAPEQLEGAETDARADVFALGVTLFEMLTGELPFAGDTLAEQLAARRAGRSLPLQKYIGDRTLATKLEPLCAAMLAWDPGARPQDGLAALRALYEVKAAIEAVPASQPMPLAPTAGALRGGAQVAMPRPFVHTSLIVLALLVGVGAALVAAFQLPLLHR